ncbi:MAG: peptidoglycan DD-metalloendopeptidase family protein [Actinomycetota bacterium]|nr:peptidoglycan DD-metalloendopeptidase family protein [Actinomycetota bacterium]
MPRTPAFAAALAAAVLLTAPAPPAGAGSLEERKQLIDTRVAALREDIAKAREREHVLSSQVETATSEIDGVEERISTLTGVVTELEGELAVHRARLARLEERFRYETHRLRFLEREHDRARRLLEHRLVDLYETADADELEVLLAVESLTDLMEKLDYFNQVGLQDRLIAAELEHLETRMQVARRRTAATKKQVSAATAALERKLEEQRAAQAALVAEETRLESARTDKRALLANVRDDRHEAEESVDDLVAASAQLAATLRARASASASRSSTPSSSGSSSASSSEGAGASSGEGAASSSGLIWPVSGPITSGFGMRWGRMHAGIDIGAPAGTPVQAAASGRVIEAGWMSGYGNLVVIDHGNGLATAYGHLSAIWVGGGLVSQGQGIGAVGCTGSCTGDHLHFEVRVNGAPVDPLGYL